MNYRIKLFDRVFGEEEKENVAKVLESGWVTEGEWAERVEEKLMEITGARHVILFPSGTTALWAAYQVYEDVTDCDTLYIPDHTFAATLTAALGHTCRIVLMDSDMNRVYPEIEGKPDGAAIVQVHLYGVMQEYYPAFKDRDRIDDACQALGVYDENGRHAGTQAKMGCLSFYADKLCSSGEGGAVITNDPACADRLRVYKNVGRHARGTYLHPYTGLTLRMTDMQCALLLPQLGRLEQIRANRTAIEAAYIKHIRLWSQQVDNARIKRMPNRFIYKTNMEPRSLINFLRARGIESRRTFAPLHREPFIEKFMERITKAASYGHSWGMYQGTIYLPFGMDLTTEQAEEIGSLIAGYDRA